MKLYTSEQGSAVAYLLITVFIVGLLTAVALSGSSGNKQTQKIIETRQTLDGELTTILSVISECIINYPTAVDVNGDTVIDAADNPNAPYPIYSDDSTGGTGDNLFDIKCPGSGLTMFSTAKGHFFPMLGDTSLFTVTYLNNAAEGVQIKFDRLEPSNTWSEAMKRMENNLAVCLAEHDEISGDCTDGTGTCLLYWTKRNSSCSSCDETALALGEQCADADVVYAGEVGGVRLYTTAADQGQYTWNNGLYPTTVTGATSTSDGKANTDTLVALSGTADADAPYEAALACRSLGSEWYLPTQNELYRLYINQGAIGGFDNTSGTYYWASTEASERFVNGSRRFNDGSSVGYRKDQNFLVRCVRR